MCHVEPPAQLITDQARRPVALKWRSSSEQSLVKRRRSLRELLADACAQVPAGEMSIIYMSYQEGAREDVADGRTERITNDIISWGYHWSVVIPAHFVTRLYARQLGHGDPDLVENVITFRAEYADPSIFDWFPSRVFTGSSEKAG